MKINKLLYLLAIGLPSLTFAQISIPKQVTHDTIYIQQANLTPSANQVGTSSIILSTGGIDTFLPNEINFVDSTNNIKSMNANTNNISIGENYFSIGGKNNLKGLTVLLGKIFTNEGIFFENSASIIPNGRELSLSSNIFHLIAKNIQIGNIFSLSQNLANFSNPFFVEGNLKLTMNNPNALLIDNTTNGPLTDRSIVSGDYAGEIGSKRTILDAAVWNKHFAPVSVQEYNIADFAATTQKFAYGSVTSKKISTDSIIKELFSKNTITNEKILNGIIDAKKVDASSIQLRIKNTGLQKGRMAIQNINQNGTVSLIEVCLRPKYVGEKLERWPELYSGSDPEWKKWGGGNTCTWVDVKNNSCPVCDSRTGATRDTWQGEWNKTSEESWQNCNNYCPNKCAQPAPTIERLGCSEGQRQIKTTTYTVIAGTNDYGRKGGSCDQNYQANASTYSYEFDSTCPQPQNGTCGAGANTCQGGAAYNSSTNGNTTTWMCPGSNGGQPTSCSYTTTPPPPSSTPSSTPSNGGGNNGGTTTSSSSTTTSSTPSPNPSPNPTPTINGVCGSQTFTCVSGTVANEQSQAGDPGEPIENTWSCIGSNGGTSDNCSKNVPTRAPTSSSSAGQCQGPCPDGSVVDPVTCSCRPTGGSSSSKQIQCTQSSCTKSITCQNGNTTIVKYTQGTQGGGNDASCMYSCNAPSPTC